MDIGSPRRKAKSKSSSRGLVCGLDSKHGEILDIKDFHEQNTSEGDVVSLVGGFEILKLDDNTQPGQKSLCKYATFPTESKILPSDTHSNQEDEDGELEMALWRMFSDESVHSADSCSISLPTPSKLVSAMKGSRERQGASPRKLTVKWAVDVYDPPPTIVSHTVNRGKKQKSTIVSPTVNRGNKQKLREERNNKQKKGKKGRKGNSSHGGSKDKKQFCKVSESTDRYYKVMDARDRIVELPGGLNGFDVARPESYCGSSFLKELLTKVPYSVAEA